MAGDLKTITIDNFSGGWNLINDEVEANESPDCYNVTINQQGAVEKRLGLSKWNASSPPAALIKIGYWSDLLQKTIWQIGSSLYDQAGSANITTVRHTFTTPARCAIVDFTTFVYAIHPIDGLLHTTDGITWSAVAAGPVGDTMAVWQNKLWTAGNPAEPERITWCSPGDGTTWEGTDRVDVRTKDTSAITALHVSSREGLLVFKDESTYRLFDSSTGAYQTLDWNFGAGGHQAVTTLFGVTMAICKHGVFATDGMSIPSELSRKINRFFKEDVLGFGNTGIWCAGFKDPKAYFSVTTTGQGANNLVLEYDTRFNAWTPHSCAVSTYVMWSPSTGEKLIGASPTVNGQAYEMYDEIGTDDGAPITSRYQTALYKPENLGLCRFRKLLLRGRGSFSLYTKLDGTGDTNDLFAIDMGTAVGSVWDAATWDSSTWGTSNVAANDTVFSLGVARDISLEVRESSSTITSSTTVLDSYGNSTKGGWALYGLKFDYVDLGGAT